jgi:hypothetical protein
MKKFPSLSTVSDQQLHENFIDYDDMMSQSKIMRKKYILYPEDKIRIIFDLIFAM